MSHPDFTSLKGHRQPIASLISKHFMNKHDDSLGHSSKID